MMRAPVLGSSLREEKEGWKEGNREKGRKGATPVLLGIMMGAF